MCRTERKKCVEEQKVCRRTERKKCVEEQKKKRRQERKKCVEEQKEERNEGKGGKMLQNKGRDQEKHRKGWEGRREGVKVYYSRTHIYYAWNSQSLNP